MLFIWNNNIQNSAVVGNLYAHFIELLLNKIVNPMDLQRIELEHLLLTITKYDMLCLGTRRNN